MSTAIKTGKDLNKNYGKKIRNIALKAGKDFAATSGKKILNKSAEATGDLVGNLIANKITSLGRSREPDPGLRSEEEKDEDNIMEEKQEMYVPP